ncbi:MAG: hypothetical protein II348_02905, partial [Clostridia bacterium]|nr:hypothetical protein [Clostridia bacterium]
LYQSDHVLEAQELEDRHLWYAAEFTLESCQDTEPFLIFGGIDTAAEIFLDGALFGTAENMHIPYEYSMKNLSAGSHEIVVHILPATLYSRQHPTPLGCTAQPYNIDSLGIRKAPYMYGWDIMPRIVSGGLWKPVTVEYRPKFRLEEVYLYTASLSGTKATLRAMVRVGGSLCTPGKLVCTVEGTCGDSHFSRTFPMFGSTCGTSLSVPEAKLWMPKNYGDSNLYDVTVSLRYQEMLCDQKRFSFGIRTVELERTSLAGDDGQFCFRVNGRKIFCMGSNWVPPDAFPSRHNEYQRRGLEMLSDLGCNIVRCWGGNTYPDEDFYDYCDRNGILVWQDFSMACAKYPNDAVFLSKMEMEATAVIRTLRNHPSLLLWSGDNECDVTSGTVLQDGRVILRKDPNENLITRELLPRVLRENDPARPYLPSSPYMDPKAVEFRTPSEDHLWGPRDFFKGTYYGTAPAHFASEIGYHGCPSPESLKKFIPQEHLQSRGDATCCSDPVWLIHAAGMEPHTDTVYAYRIPLMTKQVERIFGKASESLEKYALQSQISQAEAKKYFIERFRIGKWRRTGIIWWNLIDGWPQISDAVVDWYGCKKLAYHYIKTSQTPFCMMVDEPINGELGLVASNDTENSVSVHYTITDLVSSAVIRQGECTVPPNSATKILAFPETSGTCYQIQWDGDARGQNHFTATIGDGVDLDTYFGWMKTLGFADLLEGF